MPRSEPTGAAASRVARRAERRAHADYTGGVYGSLLAASVVTGAGALGSFPRAELVLLLLLTGAVFWGAHVHAQLFGAHLAQHTLDRAVVLHVCRDEWPILKAAVPPAAAVAVSPCSGWTYEEPSGWRSPSPWPVRWVGPWPRPAARVRRRGSRPRPHWSTCCSASSSSPSSSS